MGAPWDIEDEMPLRWWIRIHYMRKARRANAAKQKSEQAAKMEGGWVKNMTEEDVLILQATEDILSGS